MPLNKYGSDPLTLLNNLSLIGEKQVHVHCSNDSIDHSGVEDFHFEHEFGPYYFLAICPEFQ